jgi:Predicted membrane protein (DUF2142)
LSKFRLIFLAPVLALIALTAWVFASPIGSSPDDDFHLASIWCANSANTDACLPGPTSRERVVPSEIKNSSCYAYRPNASAACENQYLDKGSKPTVTTSRGNFSNNYPPVYYATMSVLVGPNIPVSVLLMRMLNVLLLVGLTTGLYLLLPRHRRPTLLWAWMLTTVPLGLFLIASNNPSSWAITGIGSAWLALLGYFETTGRRRIGLGVLFGVAGLMAAGARGDAALYLVLSIIVVGGLTFERSRPYLMRAIVPAAMVLVGVYFFLSSQQSAVTSTGLGAAPGAAAAPINTTTLLFKDLINVPSLWAGVFGTWNLGWLDTVVPAIVAFAAIVAFVGVGFSGLTKLWWQKSVAVGVLFVALWLIPTYILVKGNNAVGQNVQPRYLLPLIVVFAGVLLLTRAGNPLVVTRAQGIVVVCGLAAAQCVALYFNLHRYIDGANGHGFNLDSGIKWWWSMPIPPMAVWVVGSLAFAALLVTLVREVLRSDAIA